MKNEFKEQLLKKHIHCPNYPTNKEVVDFFIRIVSLLYPNFSENSFQTIEEIDSEFYYITSTLKQLFIHFPSLCPEHQQEAVDELGEKLELIEHQLNADLEAIFKGDPAAKSKEEVIRSYPGFYAIAAYRVAHQLQNMGIQIIPRIITEHAHEKTGIDIHPAAKIGSHFCIDHGTGVVIGETTVIGSWVKLYQGVTLGALSVDKADANKKRHPTIKNHVVIYANTTILGGETVIGEHSIIGGNVWITKSITPHSTVYYIAGDNQIERTYHHEHR